MFPHMSSVLFWTSSSFFALWKKLHDPVHIQMYSIWAGVTAFMRRSQCYPFNATAYLNIIWIRFFVSIWLRTFVDIRWFWDTLKWCYLSCCCCQVHRSLVLGRCFRWFLCSNTTNTWLFPRVQTWMLGIWRGEIICWNVGGAFYSTGQG